MPIASPLALSKFWDSKCQLNCGAQLQPPETNQGNADALATSVRNVIVGFLIQNILLSWKHVPFQIFLAAKSLGHLFSRFHCAKVYYQLLRCSLTPTVTPKKPIIIFYVYVYLESQLVLYCDLFRLSGVWRARPQVLKGALYMTDKDPSSTSCRISVIASQMILSQPVSPLYSNPYPDRCFSTRFYHIASSSNNPLWFLLFREGLHIFLHLMSFPTQPLPLL